MPLTRRSEAVVRSVRRAVIGSVILVLGGSGTVTAHGTGSNAGGMMGGTGWGFLSGTMGLWGLLWLGLLLAVPLLIGYSLLDRGTESADEGSLSVLRERSARGELSDEEFDRRKERLERSS
jgi:putative membrane protein